jgi:hypothetical protein
MPESLLRRASDFTPEDGLAAGVLVGRALKGDESLGVRVYPRFQYRFPTRFGRRGVGSLQRSRAHSADGEVSFG